MSKKEPISIELLQKKLEQIKKINNKSYSTIKELSKELGSKQTELMDFIEKNELLVDHGYKKEHTGKFKKKVLYGREIKTPIMKDLGLVVFEAYIVESLNPNNESYHERLRDINSNFIAVLKYDNYGHKHGLYIKPDPHINTSKKMTEILTKYGITKQASYWLGGFGDSHLTEIKDGFEINEEVLARMKEDKWGIIMLN